MSDRGAKALAERLHECEAIPLHGYHGYETSLSAAVLGPTGLFIADVTKHEPVSIDPRLRVYCKCGHWSDNESYFDHIGEV